MYVLPLVTLERPSAVGGKGVYRQGYTSLAGMQDSQQHSHPEAKQDDSILASESDDELARIDDQLARTGLSAAADALVKSYRLQYVQLRRQKLAELGPVPRSSRDQQVRPC